MAKTGASLARGKSSGDIWTPTVFRRAVASKFGIPYFDLACSSESVFATYGGYTLKDDALTQSWHQIGQHLLWLNCPYSNIAPWARKCAAEWKLGAEMLLLVPMGSQNWYWDYVEPYAQVYCVGRMAFDNCFDNEGRLVTAQYPKDLILAHFVPGRHGNRPVRWQWK